MRILPLTRIVCLCGSTRFREAFEEAQLQETLAGRIVLTVGGFPHADGGRVREMVYGRPRVKEMLDDLHLRKIDLADEVLVLNVGGYIGESTARELSYARQHGKVICFLEARCQVDAEGRAAGQPPCGGDCSGCKNGDGE